MLYSVLYSIIQQPIYTYREREREGHNVTYYPLYTWDSVASLIYHMIAAQQRGLQKCGVRASQQNS